MSACLHELLEVRVELPRRAPLREGVVPRFGHGRHWRRWHGAREGGGAVGTHGTHRSYGARRVGAKGFGVAVVVVVIPYLARCGGPCGTSGGVN